MVGRRRWSEEGRKREKVLERRAGRPRKARERKEHALGGWQPGPIPPTCTYRLHVCDIHLSTQQIFMKHLLHSRHCSRLGKADELAEVVTHPQGQTYPFLWAPKARTRMWVWESKEPALCVPGTLFCYSRNQPQRANEEGCGQSQVNAAPGEWGSSPGLGWSHGHGHPELLAARH